MMTAGKITETQTRDFPVIANTLPDSFPLVKPRLIVEYTIELFCDVIGRIWDVSPTVGKFILDKILRADELMTKYGYFNKALIYGTSNVSENKTEEDDTEYSPVDATADASEEPPEDVFSNASFDLEEDAADEQYKEEEGAKISFGDELGMD